MKARQGAKSRTQAIVTLRALLAERDALIHDIERAKGRASRRCWRIWKKHGPSRAA